VGAKWTSEDIKGEFQMKGGIDYSAKPKFEEKRDNWAGYDPDQFTEVVQNYEERENQKRQAKLKELKEKLQTGELAKEKGLNESDIDQLSNLSDVSEEAEQEEKHSKVKVEI
jgi:hypothetical protein